MSARVMIVTFLALSFSFSPLCVSVHDFIEKEGNLRMFEKLDASQGLIILEKHIMVEDIDEVVGLNVSTPGYFTFSFNSDLYNADSKSSKNTIHVKLQPFLVDFLVELQKHFNLAIFTGATKDEADAYATYLKGRNININPTVLNNTLRRAESEKERSEKDLSRQSDNNYVKDICERGMAVEKIILLTCSPLGVIHRSNAIIINTMHINDALQELLPVLVNLAGPLAAGVPLTIDVHPNFWILNTVWRDGHEWRGLKADVTISDSTLQEAVKKILSEDKAKHEFTMTLERVKERSSILFYTEGEDKEPVERKLTFTDMRLRIDYKKKGRKEMALENINAVTYRLEGEETPTVYKCELALKDEVKGDEDFEDYFAVRQKWNQKALNAPAQDNWLRGREILNGVEGNIKITDDELLVPIKAIVNTTPKATIKFSILVNAVKTRCTTFQDKEALIPVTLCVLDLVLEIQYKKLNLTRFCKPKSMYIEAVVFPQHVLPPRLSELSSEHNEGKFMGLYKDLEDVFEAFKKRK